MRSAAGSNLSFTDSTDEEARSTTRQCSQESHWVLWRGMRKGMGRYVHGGIVGGIGHNMVTRSCNADIARRKTLNDPEDLLTQSLVSVARPTQRRRHRRKGGHEKVSITRKLRRDEESPSLHVRGSRTWPGWLKISTRTCSYRK